MAVSLAVLAHPVAARRAPTIHASKPRWPEATAGAAVIIPAAGCGAGRPIIELIYEMGPTPPSTPAQTVRALQLYLVGCFAAIDCPGL